MPCVFPRASQEFPRLSRDVAICGIFETKMSTGHASEPHQCKALCHGKTRPSVFVHTLVGIASEPHAIPCACTWSVVGIETSRATRVAMR